MEAKLLAVEKERILNLGDTLTAPLGYIQKTNKQTKSTKGVMVVVVMQPNDGDKPV